MQEMSVPAEVLQRIDALAAKVGATAEHLWPALVKYEFWSSVGDLLVLPAPAIAAYVFYRISKASKCEVSRIPIGLVSVVMVVFFLACLSYAPSEIATLASPEAAALKSLLGGK